MNMLSNVYSVRLVRTVCLVNDDHLICEVDAQRFSRHFL